MESKSCRSATRVCQRKPVLYHKPNGVRWIEVGRKETVQKRISQEEIIGYEATIILMMAGYQLRTQVVVRSGETRDVPSYPLLYSVTTSGIVGNGLSLQARQNDTRFLAKEARYQGMMHRTASSRGWKLSRRV